MELSEARFLADHVINKLMPYCERISTAGSLRRQCKECSDIDLVLIPKRRDVTDLFGDVIGDEPIPEFIHAVQQWKKIKGEATGKYTVREVDGHHVELFICTPLNWGLILFIRTGSAEFSHKIAKRWVDFGYHGINGYLTRGGMPVAVREEHDLFRFLGLEYIEPIDRL
jgi:DNA polymerase/3'-5' exonuclease PolX